MVVFPNAKVNLGLNVCGKRADGYHNLETIFIPVPLCDILEVVPSKNSVDSFTFSGLPIPGTHEENLLVKGLKLLRAHAEIPTLSVHLHKIIPMGGGLGGGSSDAAFFLTLLNRMFNLEINKTQLLKHALELGSDCPFFLENIPAYAEGRGEKLTPISIDLSALWVVLILDESHISTRGIFQRLNGTDSGKQLKKVISTSDKYNWQDSVVNDFEEVVFKDYPKLEENRNLLISAGAFYAAMTGTGSTVYGLFDHKPKLDTGLIYPLS